MSEKTLKAALKISLYAGTTLVAQSEDHRLWQKIFNLITDPNAESDDDDNIDIKQPKNKKSSSDSFAEPNDAVGRFAKALQMSEAEIQGALRPSTSTPYLNLNPNYYESFIKNMPVRGPGAVSRIGLSATLLCLWFEAAKLAQHPSVADCQAVLGTIHIAEANITRSMKNSVWLQKTSNGIVLNPAKRSRAIEIAQAYCSEGQTLKSKK